MSKHHRSWRRQVTSDHPRLQAQRHAVALYDVMRHKSPELPISDISIDESGLVSMAIPAAFQFLNSKNEDQMVFPVAYLKDHPEFCNARGLILWLAPSFRNGLGSHLADEMLTEFGPMHHTLKMRHRIPLQFVPLTEAMSPSLREICPTALMIFTLPEHSKTLVSDVHRDLMLNTAKPAVSITRRGKHPYRPPTIYPPSRTPTGMADAARSPGNPVQALALHMLEAYGAQLVNEYGEVDIPVLPAWRTNVTITSNVSHQKSGAEPFGTALRSKKSTDRQAFAFWLDPTILGNRYPASRDYTPAEREEIGSAVAQAGKALAAKHGLSTLESRIYFPDVDWRRKVNHSTAAAVVFATTPSQQKTLQGSVRSDLIQSRIEAQVIQQAAQEGLHSVSARSRAALPQLIELATVDGAHNTNLGIHDLLRFMCGNPGYFDMPTSGVMPLRYPGSDIEHHLVIDNVPLDFIPSCGLVMWVDPSHMPKGPIPPKFADQKPHVFAAEDLRQLELDRFDDNFRTQFTHGHIKLQALRPPTYLGSPYPIVFFCDGPHAGSTLKRLQEFLVDARQEIDNDPSARWDNLGKGR